MGGRGRGNPEISGRGGREWERATWKPANLQLLLFAGGGEGGNLETQKFPTLCRGEGEGEGNLETPKFLTFSWGRGRGQLRNLESEIETQTFLTKVLTLCEGRGSGRE